MTLVAYCVVIFERLRHQRQKLAERISTDRVIKLSQIDVKRTYPKVAMTTLFNLAYYKGDGQKRMLSRKKSAKT